MLTIGMLTHDDYHGVYFTINAIRMYHPEVLDKIHFTVIDNNPGSPHGRDVRNLCHQLPNVHYHTVSGVTSTSFRNLIFELAPTEQVLCIDCHVLLWPKSIQRLLRFYENNPGFRHDLIHGPLLTETHDVLATHMEPNFRGWNFGTWANNGMAADETADPFEIPMHGMGLFACSRTGWPRFASGLRYFGAEEGTIHERFRRLGRRSWCLPFLRWVHRFGRPDGPKYPNPPSGKVWNYMVAFRDCGLSVEWVEDYFARHLNPDVVEANRMIDFLRVELNNVPPSSLPPAPEGYQPFMGLPIQILD